ncbi:hypothetical protein QWZ08_22720 [Ferruginibacter paludis]|uniref:hypothetical protein n=1 Tax=Ferruginibacter paludis TaxID=1310417 RepID=UPI0025B5331C|nr:hypothetical protein [Ferruginibacter paludis]MDN3658475.1 hypothetical protein [Ferruginibacter paludis]
MKKYFLPIIFSVLFSDVFGLADSVVVPIQRQRNHERIKEEQVKCDKADGKLDGMIKVSSNEEVNLQVTDAIFRKIKGLQDFIETTSKVPTNNEKIRQLNYVQEVVLNFRLEWKAHKLNPVLAPLLINNFEKILRANIDSLSMASIIEEAPYEIGKINTEIFKANKGYNESKKIIYLKFCTLNPDKILSSIRPFVNEPFADSMVVLASLNNPKQLYDYASSGNSPEAKLIQKNTNPLVTAIVKISHTPNALFYFPFLDDIINGKQSIDSIKKLIGDGEERMDNVGYFKLLVKTEINYQQRLIAKDTPVAMFGGNGLREMLQTKAIKYFINPINELHEQNNLAIRMKAIEPLSAQDLYYVIVMGENDIYTSSYKHSFARLLQKMGTTPRGDELMLSVNMDFFRKFIKMAANFNQLDVFLKTMPQDKATVLMKAFVANLDKSNNLEDAVDVADSYSSIKDTALLQTILKNVSNNEQRSMNDNNGRGKIIYSLLKTIFLSADSSNIDLTSEIGIPSIYSVENKYLADDSGRIVQQVFFYGDDDGKANFSGFMNSFNTKEWKVIQQKEWVEIKSLKGRKKVWIYANLPLDSDKNLDDTAQAHLTRYLEKKDIVPSIVIHRGHSYWLPGTINRMAGSAKIIVLGSCGGYKNLSKILSICPDAHIISTKEIGKGDINRPIINYLNQALVSGNTIVWKDMWAALNKVFYADPNKEVRESWDDYVPPYRNLGAIFIKAYNKKTEL